MKDTYLLFYGEYIQDIEIDTGRIIGYSTTKEKSKALKMEFDTADEIRHLIINQQEEVREEDVEFDFVKEDI